MKLFEELDKLDESPFLSFPQKLLDLITLFNAESHFYTYGDLGVEVLPRSSESF